MLLDLPSFLQSQHHDDEKRALSREIIVLNNHLMEAKLTIEKLQEDNVRVTMIRNSPHNLSIIICLLQWFLMRA